MKRPVFSTLMVMMLFLSACEALEERPGETIGSIVGVGVGALLGSKIGDGSGKLVGAAVGAIAGRWVGSELGKALDEHDRELAETTAQDTLENNESGTTSTWRNPDTGNSGSIRPGNTYSAENGEDCRDFESSVNVEGETETATGRACRQIDGSWLIVP